jgi:cation:H+ antiporter
LLNISIFTLAFVALLLGATVFTNGIEWLGHKTGVSESATGSILAAVGTALPETMIPVIAIYTVWVTGGASSADDVGVGAILGAPFMLATIAMFLIGCSLIFFKSRRSSGAQLKIYAPTTLNDLSFFIIAYTLALIAAIVPWRTLSIIIAFTLLILYVIYLRRTLRSGVEIEAESLDDLYLGKVYDRTLGRISSLNIPDQSDNPHVVLVAFQSLLALGIIILGAHMFIDAVEWLSSDVLSLPLAVIALLLAPLATELPEKMNSVIWISRGKDVLALGNITGALVFQSTIPVVLGILFTSWNLSFNWGTVGFLNALSAILAIAGAFLIYVRVKYSKDGMLDSFPFLIGGILYLLFIIILVYHLMHFDLSIVSH